MDHSIVGQIFSYWWLIFLLPAFGGIIRATFGGRRRNRRHDRRYQDGHYPGAPQQPAPMYAPPPAPSPQRSVADQAAKLMAEHEKCESAWLDYELDVSKMIDFPMMSDVREPLTADFLRAKRVADSLKPESPEALTTPEQLTEYRDAVRNFEVAFELAEREAHRIKDRNFKPEERERLDTARKLLKMATDEASTPAERQLAYQRARSQLDGLLLVPDAAVAALEAKVADPKTADPNPADSGPPNLSAADEQRLRQDLERTVGVPQPREHKLPQQRS